MPKWEVATNYLPALISQASDLLALLLSFAFPCLGPACAFVIAWQHEEH